MFDAIPSSRMYQFGCVCPVFSTRWFRSFVVGDVLGVHCRCCLFVYSALFPLLLYLLFVRRRFDCVVSTVFVPFVCYHLLYCAVVSYPMASCVICCVFVRNYVRVLSRGVLSLGVLSLHLLLA